MWSTEHTMWIGKFSLGMIVVCAFLVHFALRIVDPSNGFSLRSSSSRISSKTVPDKSHKSRSANAPAQTLQEFTERCHSEGVVVCEGFDSADTVHPAGYPASGLYPAAYGAF